MKIEKTQCEKVVISDVKGLDSITVFLEDFGPRRGQITIKIWYEVWSACWGGMGERTISQFFCSCDHHYLAKNLSRVKSSEPDYDAFRCQLRKTIGKRLANKNLSKENGKALLIELDDCAIEEQSDYNCGLFSRIHGHGDWMFDIPEKPNHEYKYLCRVIDTVKEALKQ